jgi:monoamine oxidase
VHLGTKVAVVSQDGGGVEVQTSAGDGFRGRVAVVAVPVNALRAIAFSPELSEGKLAAVSLGQASRGIKLFVRARGEPVLNNSIRPGHPFGYLASEELFEDGTQLLIGFGRDASVCDAGNLAWVQRSLDELLPGYEVVEATAHDWLGDEFSRGTWAIHRPGWYEHHHAAMQVPEGRVLFAGSDIANGWAGFIDGAIESGLRAGARASAMSEG